MPSDCDPGSIEQVGGCQVTFSQANRDLSMPLKSRLLDQQCEWKLHIKTPKSGTLYFVSLAVTELEDCGLG
jgi:hypothetical protein